VKVSALVYVEVTPRNFLVKPSKSRIKVEFETRRGCQTNLYGRAKFVLPIVQVEGKVYYRVDEGDGFDFLVSNSLTLVFI
jgi:hypothetical protein